MPPPRAILFDLDNTLYDRAEAIALFAAAQHKRFASIFHALGPERFTRRFIELDDNGSVWKDRVYESLLKEAGADELLVAALVSDYVERFCDHCVLCDSVSRTLVELRRRGLKLAIVTNGRVDVQSRTIRSLGLALLVDAVLISEEEAVRKPEAEIFLRATLRLGIKPGDAVFVGDNPIADVEGAKRAGLAGVWLRNAFFHQPSECDAIIDRIEDILLLDLASLGSGQT